MPKLYGTLPEVTTLSELLSPAALKLLESGGKEFIRQIGMDVVRGVVLDVLTGKNLRESTEVLTRRRIATLNLATVNLFVKGAASSADFVKRLPDLAVNVLARGRLKKSERWLAQWVLGLTDKAFQNVLRDERESLAEYRDRYVEACREVIARHVQEHGELSGVLKIGANAKAEVDWLMLTYLLNTIGAQTLAIRGSEKSAYGKLFEKLILGSLLHILGFKHVPPGQLGNLKRVFWLASRGERRESDATLLYEAGKGVRFDIGFIGRGNPEISLDKVTRFEREILMGRSRWYLATIIIVDRVGLGSRIERLAQAVDGTIVQMSAAYWPQQVARELNRVLGFKHELVNMDQARIGKYLEQKVRQVPLDDFALVNEE
ncbi:MAG TPA: CfrBI family restriction endonuclease [Anaerolineae bacterium]|nr:CfrBI family restriction endonuclease [Anaerolineae bacterium]